MIRTSRNRRCVGGLFFSACVIGAAAATAATARALFAPKAKSGHIRPVLASPRDYGFATPVPAPPLPAGMDVFTPPLLGNPSGPGVAEFTRTGGPDETLTVAGPDFTAAAKTRFRFFGQTRRGDAVTAERAAHVADSVAACVVLPAHLPTWSLYLVWPRVAGGTFGRPVAVNRTDAWWVGPDEALAGETVSVHGRNLAHGNAADAAAWVYVKPAGGTAGRWVKPASVNPYRVSFRVPALSPGLYEVWAHNGHGAQFGWGGPLALRVLSRSPWAGQDANRFSVRDYGATGDGVADDTAAIRRALDAAGEAAPAAVYFPPGTYTVNGVLEAKNAVSWIGAGKDASVIKAGPSFASAVEPAGQALIHSDSAAVGRVAFRNLTIDGAGNLGKRSLVLFRHHAYVQLTGSRFRWKGAVGGFNLGSNTHLTVADCEFVGDQVFLADSKQVVLRNNDFRLTDFANAAIISWGGSEVAVVNNRARDHDPKAAAADGVGSGRFFVSQSHPDANRHFYIADNTTRDMAPPVDIGDANQGEQILFEVGTSVFSARPVASTPTTATFASAPPVAASQDVVVVKGRGTGQFRRVSAVHGNTVTVAPAWSVVPDRTSVLGIGPAQTRSVVYRNRLDGKADYATYETASVALSLYGNVSHVVFADNRLTDLRTGLVDEYSQVPDPRTPTPSALFFNLITRNSVDGAYRGVRIITNFLTAASGDTWGHLGNTYRRNTLRRIHSQGVHFGADQGGFSGGDLNQDVFEHNAFVHLPTAVWVGKATAWLNNPVNTKFENLVFYKNTFARGAAAFAGSKALDVSAARTSTWRSGNVWTGFASGAKDQDTLPAPATSQAPPRRRPVKAEGKP